MKHSGGKSEVIECCIVEPSKFTVQPKRIYMLLLALLLASRRGRVRDMSLGGKIRTVRLGMMRIGYSKVLDNQEEYY